MRHATQHYTLPESSRPLTKGDYVEFFTKDGHAKRGRVILWNPTSKNIGIKEEKTNLFHVCKPHNAILLPDPRLHLTMRSLLIRWLQSHHLWPQTHERRAKNAAS